MTDSFDSTLDALEDERRYFAKELHDGLAQSSLQIGLQIGICRKLLERGKIEMYASELARLEALAQQASFQVRDLIADLRPPEIDPTADLNEHLRHLINLHTERGGPPITYRIDIAPVSLTLSSRQTLAIARIVQESLLNVRKHAEANNAWVYAAENDTNFWVSIADDGLGFNLAKVANGSTDQGGAGLANMQARAEAINGALTIARGPNGRGTRVSVTWPK